MSSSSSSGVASYASPINVMIFVIVLLLCCVACCCVRYQRRRLQTNKVTPGEKLQLCPSGRCLVAYMPIYTELASSSPELAQEAMDLVVDVVYSQVVGAGGMPFNLVDGDGSFAAAMFPADMALTAVETAVAIEDALLDVEGSNALVSHPLCASSVKSSGDGPVRIWRGPRITVAVTTCNHVGLSSVPKQRVCVAAAYRAATAHSYDGAVVLDDATFAAMPVPLPDQLAIYPLQVSHEVPLYLAVKAGTVTERRLDMNPALTPRMPAAANSNGGMSPRLDRVLAGVQEANAALKHNGKSLDIAAHRAARNERHSALMARSLNRTESYSKHAAKYAAIVQVRQPAGLTSAAAGRSEASATSWLAGEATSELTAGDFSSASGSPSRSVSRTRNHSRGNSKSMAGSPGVQMRRLLPRHQRCSSATSAAGFDISTSDGDGKETPGLTVRRGVDGSPRAATSDMTMVSMSGLSSRPVRKLNLGSIAERGGAAKTGMSQSARGSRARRKSVSHLTPRTRRNIISAAYSSPRAATSAAADDTETATTTTPRRRIRVRKRRLSATPRSAAGVLDSPRRRSPSAVDARTPSGRRLSIA